MTQCNFIDINDVASHYDLVVIGGGATGLCLVHGLLQDKCEHIKSVLLVEKLAHLSSMPGRAIALNKNSLKFLQRLTAQGATIEEKFGKARLSVFDLISQLFTPIKDISVLTDTQAKVLNLQAQKFHLNNFGAVVDLADLQIALEKSLELFASTQQHLHIDILKNTAVKDIAPFTLVAVDRDQVDASNCATTRDSSISKILTLCSDAGSATITSDLTVVASGTRFINGLEVFNSSNITTDLGQKAIICDVVFNKPQKHRATEFFTYHGPVAFLPIADNAACVVWCAQSAIIDAYLAHPNLFAQQLNLDLAYIDGELDKDSYYHYSQELQGYSGKAVEKHRTNNNRIVSLSMSNFDLKQKKSLDNDTASQQASCSSAAPLNHTRSLTKRNWQNSLHIIETIASFTAKYPAVFEEAPEISSNCLAIRSISDLASFNLPASRLTTIASDTVCCLGNACHTLHPVSGQGFNLAVLGVQNLIKSLVLENGQSKDFHRVTTTYQRLHLPVINDVYLRTVFLAGNFIQENHNLTLKRYLSDLLLRCMSKSILLQGELVYPSMGFANSKLLNKILSFAL